MDEGNAMAAGADAGHLVDQPEACGDASGQGAVEIGNPIADVVNTWAAARDEFRDGAVRALRLEQLHVRPAEGERYDPGAIGTLRGTGSETEDVAIEGKGAVDTLDGYADVGDLGAVGHGRPRQWV